MTGEIAAIVPAAGESRRMGTPKLTLQVGGVPLIARVIAALQLGGASPVVVVAPHGDVAGSAELIRQATQAGAEAVLRPVVQPPDMRASIEIALEFLSRQSVPPRTVLISPGDSPGLTRRLVAAVVEAAVEDPSRIVVPTVAGKRGHPIALPWRHAEGVPGLPEGVGLNALLARHAADIRELPVEDPGALADLDTPEDYKQWSGVSSPAD
jgi:molybdenum cofactor cytidylyltransferase